MQADTPTAGCAVRCLPRGLSYAMELQPPHVPQLLTIESRHPLT
jgi:hypothetical protein